MEIARYFENPPDHVFKVRGSREELEELEQRFWKISMSMIAGNPLLAVLKDGKETFETSYSFTDPKEAMMFRLAVI